MSWERGRSTVEPVLAGDELQHVTPSPAMAVLGRLHALRRRRNRTEYPEADSAGVNSGDAQQALETAEGVLEAAFRLLTSGRLGVFE